MPIRPLVHTLLPIDAYDEMLAEWVARGLKKPGKGGSELGRVLGVGPSEVSKMKSGKRKLAAAQLFVIAEYLEEPIPVPGTESLFSTQEIPIIGEAGRPAWFDADPLEQSSTKLPFVPHGRFRELPHFATKIVGNNMNLFLADGMFAVWVPYWKARKSLTDKDFVLVKLMHETRGLHKRLFRQLHIAATHHELRSASSDPRLNLERNRFADDLVHIDGTGETIEVVGLVLWQCGPIGL